MYCANKKRHVISGSTAKRSFFPVLVVFLVFFHVPDSYTQATSVALPMAKFSMDVVLLGVGILIVIDAYCRGEAYKNVCFRQQGTLHLGQLQRQMNMSLSEWTKFRTKMQEVCVKILQDSSCGFLRLPIPDQGGATTLRTQEEALSAEDRDRIKSAAANHARLQQTKTQYGAYLAGKITEIKKCLQKQPNISEKQTQTVQKALEGLLRQWHFMHSRLYYASDVMKIFATLYNRLRTFEKFCGTTVKIIPGKNNIVRKK